MTLREKMLKEQEKFSNALDILIEGMEEKRPSYEDSKAISDDGTESGEIKYDPAMDLLFFKHIEFEREHTIMIPGRYLNSINQFLNKLLSEE